jgi:hypothetical protein
MSPTAKSTSRTMLLLAASGLALAGCKIDNRPLLARGEPPPAMALPPPGPLEPGEAAPIYPASAPAAYPYAERAYALDRAVYRTSPDSGFYYGDEEPWVWETADDSLMFAEPYGDDYRFYYYQPGDPYPYFVRDAGYGYAFGPDGALIALFNAAGALLSADQYDRAYPDARQYWTRGYDMYRDYGRAPRRAVNPTLWSQRAPSLQAARQTWIQAPAEQPAWRAWRNSAAGRLVVQRTDAVRPAGAATPAAVAPSLRPARGEPAARRFARNLQPAEAPRVVAPAAEAHGRFAAARAPIVQPERPAEAEGRGHARAEGVPARARAAQPRAVVQPRDRGGGREPERGPAQHMAQAAPAPQLREAHGHRGRGGGEGPHPQPAAAPQRQAGGPGPQAHGQGAGGPRPHQGQPHGAPQNGQPHGGGDGGNGHGHDKHGR